MEKKNFAYYWERIGTLMIFVFMILVTSVFAPPQFLSPGNLVQILTQSATTMLIACGEFFDSPVSLVIEAPSANPEISSRQAAVRSVFAHRGRRRFSYSATASRQ